MINIANNFVEYLNLREFQMAMYDLFKLAFMILFIAHISACILNFVAFIEIRMDINNCWIIK